MQTVIDLILFFLGLTLGILAGFLFGRLLISEFISDLYLLSRDNCLNKISQVTREWEKAENYHQYILSRLADLGKADEEINNLGIEVDLKVERLQSKIKKEIGVKQENE